MKKNICNLFFYCCLLFIPFILSIPLYAQKDKEELEKKKKKLENDINYTNELLQKTKTNKQLSQNQLVTLNIKIGMREELISTIRTEINLLSKQIHETESIIESMESDLRQLKEEYAKMIYYAYKNRNAYNRLMFLFSAKDFNQAYRRLKYMQQYTEYRHRQAILIKKTQEVLNKKVAELQNKKAAKQALFNTERTQKNNLEEEKNEQQSLLIQLRTKEAQLKKELQEKQNQSKKLQKAIDEIIRKSKFNLTPEALKLSANFENNKGKLPWPLEKAIITSYFGPQSHPLLPGITIDNNGIDLSTSKDSKARAIFDGEVSGVIIIPGAGKAVMIRHGEYLSVYSNLKDVFVQKGSKVKTKQEIGTIITEEDKGKTELHIEIWKATTKETIKLNPVQWLFPTH